MTNAEASPSRSAADLIRTYRHAVARTRAAWYERLADLAGDRVAIPGLNLTAERRALFTGVSVAMVLPEYRSTLGRLLEGWRKRPEAPDGPMTELLIEVLEAWS